MKKTYLSILIILISINCLAQQKFKEGQITLQNGNTIDCLIKYTHTQSNPEKIIYKLNIEDQENEYNQRDIQGFVVENRVKFVKETVDFDNSEEEINKLSYNRAPDYVKVTALLEVLVEGSATLYRLHKNGKVRYFYKLEGQEIKPLIYKKFLVASTTFNENLDYINELNNNVNCTGKRITEKRELQYHTKELIKYFNEYNKCKGEESTFNMTKEKAIIRVGARIGYGIINSDISYKDFPAMEKKSREGNRKDAGVHVEINLPNYLRKWSIVGELYYSDITQDFVYKFDNSWDYRSHDSSAKIQTINIAAGLRYNFYLNSNNKDSKIIYIESLFDLHGFKVGDNYMKRKVISNNTPGFDLARFEYSTSRVYNLSFGVGFPIYNNFGGNIRYNFPAKYLSSDTEEYDISSFIGSLTYTF